MAYKLHVHKYSSEKYWPMVLEQEHGGKAEWTCLEIVSMSEVAKRAREFYSGERIAVEVKVEVEVEEDKLGVQYAASSGKND